ncbi:type II toxin-antitoxin system RelE/ParE family toxin [Peteryoungia ipomoeae]|uniref:Toxin n=1 Tax=Peteryoungia ipomoeae TaxID=1210932 RepID=A0A4S8NZM2_9HYPH|nr:type II toxin-antitoxin system RelE/ParE family toxin [Peteryoungia ipomoeae]THV23223.1 type II toxin-antitoxin system RelE/ParE family toxin [Peteryoungia ipomoeae]
MAEIRLSPAARRDFLKIGDYTRNRWSEVQAEQYLRRILEVITEIGRHPFSGAVADRLREGYRRRRSGSHLIFYVIRDDGTIEVVRILHERADLPRQLED